MDRNTYKLFELEDHQPTYAYELEQAVDDEFLVPPRAISVPLKFQREGIKYNELSVDEQEDYELQEQFYDPETGQLKEEIGSSALNQWLFNTDTVNKVLMHLMENGVKVEGGDKLGKTIVFAKNTKHADFIVEQFDKNYPHLAGKFCRKIDFTVKYTQSLIDEFSINEKYPQIAVSVDMLDTGIDVPEVVNLVFFKLVRSKTKFWQMIGRGTRLCENLFGPDQDKKEFVVFDYCQNLDFFDANPEGYESGVQHSVKQRVFNRRLDLAVALQDGKPDDESVIAFSDQLKDQMHEVVAAMNLDNFIVRKHRQDVETYAKRDRWQVLGEDDARVISNNLSGLPSPDKDDEFARRFDLLILNLQFAILQKSATQTNYELKVREIAKGLENKSTIPAVQAQLSLIQDLQTGVWWQEVTLPMLEDVRLKLRKLTRFIDPEEGLNALNVSQAIYTDISDSPTPDPSALATQLINDRTRAILIIDNCLPDLHHRLTQICSQQHSTVSLLTIEYDVRDDLPEETCVFRLEPASEEIIDKLICNRYGHIGQVDARTIASFSGGNARVAIALANTVQQGETLSGFRNEQLFERLFWQRHDPNETLLESAQLCALVYSFEGTDADSDKSELKVLASLADKSGKDLYRDVAELKNRDLVQSRSVWRAVLSHAIANRLAKGALKIYPKTQ